MEKIIMMITKQQAQEKMIATNGQLFTAEFFKKDGTHRTMTCRTGVKKHLKGGVLKYDPASKGLFGVWEYKEGYRMININTLTSLTIKKKVYSIEGS